MKSAILLLTPFLLHAEFKPLFDGRSLDGWVHEGPRASFSAADGEIAISGYGNAPNWLRTEREYENFRLRFEYKPARWAEAMVILRAPRWGRPAQAGLSLMLAHDFHGQVTKHVTGAVPGVLPPKTALPESYAQWRAVEVTVEGDRFRAAIDGVVVQDLRLGEHEELRHRLKRGYIGFPDMGHAYRLRRIEIEDLGSPTRFVDLFDGISLDGWRLRGAGNWAVREGAIYGFNGHGILYAPPSLQDFELTLLVRSHNHVNAGVFLRGEPEGPNRGFEVQIYSPVESVYPTGSVYGMQRSRVSVEYEERWFLMQVRVEGRRCMVRLDGETVADYSELPERHSGAGKIGLQIHMDNASVEFRDLRVRVL